MGKLVKLGKLGVEYIFFGFIVRIGIWGCNVVEGGFNDIGLRFLGEGEMLELV